MTYKVLDSLQVGVPENAKIVEWSDGVSSWAQYSSDGDPNGVVVATQGSLCMDRTNAELYKKTTASGNTGWVIIGSGDDSSIQAGTMATCTEDRIVDMSTHDLMFLGLVDETHRVSGDLLLDMSDGSGKVEVGLGSSGALWVGPATRAGFGGRSGRLELASSKLDGNSTVGFMPPQASFTSYSIAFPDAPTGTSQHLYISGWNGSIATMSWGTMPAEESITLGTLSEAQEARTVPMSFENLTFENVNDLVVGANTILLESTINTIEGTITEFKSQSSVTGGTILLKEGTSTGANYVGFKAPNTTDASYVMTLPDHDPTNGQVLKVQSGGGTSTLVMQWADSTGSTDTNITTGTVLAAGAANPRTFDFSDNPVTFQNVDGFIVHSNDTGVEVHNTVATNAGKLRLMESVNAGGTGYVGFSADPTMITSYDMKMPSTPGADGQILKITSGGGTGALFLSWANDENSPGATDSSIQAGTMGACVEDRVVDMSTHQLKFEGATNYWVEAANAVYLDSPGTVVRNSDSAKGGVLQLREATGTGGQYVSLQAASALGSTYNIILPSTFGGANQVLSITGGGGTAVNTLSWTTPSDRFFTGTVANGANLPTATENALVDMNTNDVLFQNSGTFTVQATTADMRTESGVLVGRFTTTGMTLAGGKSLTFNNAAGDNISFAPPASITTTGQTYTLPPAFPTTDKVLQSSSSGVLSWVDTSGADTNRFFTGRVADSANLTAAQESTTVPMAGYSVTFDAVANFNVNSTAINTFTGSVPGKFVSSIATNAASIQLFESPNGGNANYVALRAAADLSASPIFTLPTALPSGGTQVLNCDTGGNMFWADDATGAGDNYYLTGDNLPAASTDINVDFGSNEFNVNNVTNWSVDATTSTRFNTRSFIIDHLDAAVGGRIAFEDGDSGTPQYATIGAPANVTASWTLLLPETMGSAGQVLKIASSSGQTAQTYWGTDNTGGGAGDNFYFTGTGGDALPNASTAVSVPMSGFSVTFDNTASFIVETASSDVYSQDGVNLYTRTNSSGLFVAEGRKLYLTNAGGENVAFKANASMPLSSQTYTWPAGLPASNKILQSDSAGNLSWVDDQNSGGDNYYFTGTSGGGTDLPQASENVTVSMETYDVTFDNVGVFTTRSATTNVRTAAGDLITSVSSSGLTVASGKILRFNNASADGIQFVAPSSIPISGQTYTWPTTQPGTDQYLKVNSSGVMSWDTPPGGSGDNFYLTGTASNVMPDATANVSTNFADNDWTLQNVNTFHLNVNSVIITNDDGTTESTRIDQSGVKLANGHYVSWKAQNNENEFTIKAHPSATTASYQWPQSLPSGTPDKVMKCSNTGQMYWSEDLVGAGGNERQKDADDLGNSGASLSIDFDSGSYDNKRVTLDADCLISVNATRSTRYTIHLEATGSKRNITWDIGDNDLPLFVLPTNPVQVALEYSPEAGWECHSTEVDAIQITAATIEAATSNGGSYTIDCGNVYRAFEIVGDVNRTSLTWNEFDNLPSKAVCVVSFSSGQTNTPLISAGFMKTGGDPSHAGRTIWTVLNAPGLGQVICARDEV